MKRMDFLWILAFPLYLLAGTLRHELSHDIGAMLEGADIMELVFWPTLKANGRIQWGCVRWQGETDGLFLAAPYFCDL